ncbi:hypothetical protein CONPUDRAFT_85380 [Coniophora puteana RWD-64-598 SS2]|uniref:F-box domain-containing protein n=1 Tax=Coniophora puteana (strain RWD-64-598) TaxID=741705 RepID=A0A5M3MA77_CONPW|nr:uncharacterized protein CONPUDRAFT_85380 [Coniophora puteana RWD-64-598 SS2]EIW75690.1 hypothetical protein CONPUDRAFT_85380 [Coniophora puteana RWD-64-598 SS2]
MNRPSNCQDRNNEEPGNAQAHPALFISEITYHLASFVASKSDLVSLALTCHALSEPALDMLWTDPPSMLPLLLHLPGKPVEVVEDEQDKGVKKTVSLNHAFTIEDWDAFLKRARRVTWLAQATSHRIDSEYEPEVTYHDISPNVFRELCSAPTDIIFPRLKQLQWGVPPEYAEHALPFLRMILKPTITDLEIYPFPIAESDFLMSLEQSLPNLNVFRYREQEIFAAPGEDITTAKFEAFNALRSRIIRSWKRVENLWCGYLDLDALNHLAGLKGFKVARIPLAPSIVSLPFPPGSFPSLQALTTFAPEGQSLRIFADFLRVVKIPFVNLHLGAGFIEATAFEDLIRVLVDSEHTDKMEALRIEELTFHRADGDGVTMPVMEPLFAFANLRELFIDVLRVVRLDDGDILRMAEAWPNLERFSINMRSGWKQESSITLRGLRSLVERLPHLFELRIAIDASAEVEGLDLGAFELAPGYAANDDCMLFRLDLLDSKIGDNHNEVAAYIADIFRGYDLQLEDVPLAWTFGFVPRDLLAECMLYKPGWNHVSNLLYAATEEAWGKDILD